MGVDVTAAATEATEAGRATSTLIPSRSTRTPTSSRPSRHLPLSGHCGPGHLAAGSISGLRDGPCGQGGGEGRRGPRGVRYKEVLVRKEGEEGRPDRGRGMAARPGSGREERRGKGGGRESGGGNNVAGAAPAEFRFRTPPPRLEFGTSRRLPGSCPGRWIGGPRGLPALHAPEAPAATGWLGREGRLAGGRPRRRRGGTVAPLGPHPGGPPGQGAGWGGSGRAAAVSAAAAKLGLPGAPLGGSSQAWREEARPGSSARGSAPARGGLPGARRGVGRRSGAPCREPGGTAGGVSAPTPCPHLPASAEGSARCLPED